MVEEDDGREVLPREGVVADGCMCVICGGFQKAFRKCEKHSCDTKQQEHTIQTKSPDAVRTHRAIAEVRQFPTKSPATDPPSRFRRSYIL